MAEFTKRLQIEASRMGVHQDLISRLTPTLAQQMIDAWRSWRQGTLPNWVRYADIDVNGRTTIENGRVESVLINIEDDPQRQELAFLHEMFHVYMLPLLTHKPQYHWGIHALASAAQRLIPLVEAGLGKVSNTQKVHQELKDMSRVIMNDAGSVILGPESKVITREKFAGASADVTVRNWGGWMMKIIKDMYEAQQYLWPLCGCRRLTSLASYSKYRAASFDAFWNQLIQSLDSATGRTTKGYSSKEAVASTITDADPSGSFTFASVGLIISVSVGDDAPLGPFLATHFENGSNDLPAIIVPEKGTKTVEWLCLSAVGDRGGGIVEAGTDHNVQIPADAIPDGARVFAETVNYRELQA